MEQETKVCINCGCDIAIQDLSKDNNNKNGYRRLCKPCHNKRHTEYKSLKKEGFSIKKGVKELDKLAYYTGTSIEEFFIKRYDYLLECSTNILKLIDKQSLKTELLSDAFIYINENKDKLQHLIDDGKIEAITVRWMTMSVKWNNTPFKKNWVYPHKNESESLLDDVETYSIIEEDISEEDYLQQEMDIQNKMNHIHHFISNQPIDQQILYDLVYNKEINTSGKLSRHTGIPRTGSYRLIEQLKKNIKNSYNDSNNNKI